MIEAKTQTSKNTSYFHLVVEIARLIIKLAAIDMPSGSTAASRYATDENATYGAGNLGQRPVGDSF